MSEWRDKADTLRCKRVRVAGYFRKALRNCINEECASYYYYLEVKEINNTIGTATRQSERPFRLVHDGRSSVYVKVTVGFDECAAVPRIIYDVKGRKRVRDIREVPGFYLYRRESKNAVGSWR